MTFHPVAPLRKYDSDIFTIYERLHLGGIMDFGVIFWFYLFANLVLSAIVAYAAGEKGRDPAGFFGLSFFFSFLVGILVLLALPNLKHKDANEYFECPACAENVKLAAKICKHCGTNIEATAKAIIRKAELKIEEQARQAAEDLAEDKKLRLENQKARKAFLVRLGRSRSFYFGLSAILLVSLGLGAWNLFGPRAPDLTRDLTSKAPSSTKDLKAAWLDSLEKCGYSATKGEPAADELSESRSGKTLWTMISSQDYVSLDIDFWNSDRENIECVSQNIFATSLTTFREGEPRIFANGYSQGVDVATKFEGPGKASGYFFRWKK